MLSRTKPPKKKKMEDKSNRTVENFDEVCYSQNSASNAETNESNKALDTEMKKMTVTETKTENSESGSGEDGDEKFAHPVRMLTEAEIAKLQKDVNCVSDFKQNKLEKEAQKNWDLFYKRNTTKFFKDRHWTKREFDELCPVAAEVYLTMAFVLKTVVDLDIHFKMTTILLFCRTK